MIDAAANRSKAGRVARSPMARRLAALCVLAWAVTATPAQAQGWTSTYIGFVGAGGFIGDVNNLGQVVGQTEPNHHGFVTAPHGQGLRDLGTLGGLGASVYGINDAGRITGVMGGDIIVHAFIADADGGNLRDLGTLGGGGCCSGGEAINASGQIAGASTSSGARPRWTAFLTGPNGGAMTDLGGLQADGSPSYAHGLNDAGQVVGQSRNRAFITGPGGLEMRDLGDLGNSRDVVAVDINNSGQVVGTDFVAGVDNVGQGQVELRAFITGPDGTGMRQLGNLGGGDSAAGGINDAGMVVGTSRLPDGAFHAFVTGRDGIGLVDLQVAATPPADRGTFVSASAINDRGEIALVTSGGYAYLLTPIPEPATAALVFSGALLLMSMRRCAQTSRLRKLRPRRAP